MSTVDNKFFPHIMDEIWRHLDLETALGLRLFCYDWFERANKRLQFHMVADPCPSGLRLNVKTEVLLSQQKEHHVPRYLLDWPTLIEPAR